MRISLWGVTVSGGAPMRASEVGWGDISGVLMGAKSPTNEGGLIMPDSTIHEGQHTPLPRRRLYGRSPRSKGAGGSFDEQRPAQEATRA